MVTGGRGKGAQVRRAAEGGMRAREQDSDCPPTTVSPHATLLYSNDATECDAGHMQEGAFEIQSGAEIRCDSDGVRGGCFG